MGDARYIGRIGGLAVALGIGAGIVAMPSVAYAKPAGDGSDTASASESGDARSGNDNIRRATESLSSLVNSRASKAEPAPERPSISVSVNGWNLAGTSAESTKGSAAVVYGARSSAIATEGPGNIAVVIGNGSRASAGRGTGNRAIVRGDGSVALAAIGSGNTATVRGNNSGAQAGGGTGNTATAIGDASFARAGTGGRIAEEPQRASKMEAEIPNSNNNTATAINTGTIISPEGDGMKVRAGIFASAGVGAENSNNTATITNTGEITGVVEALAGSGVGSADNVAIVENTGTITGYLLTAVGAAENNTNNTARVSNSGIITNTGEFAIRAGGNDGNTNNTVNVDNISAITIFGPASLFVVADTGTPTNPAVANFYNDTPFVIGALTEG